MWRSRPYFKNRKINAVLPSATAVKLHSGSLTYRILLRERNKPHSINYYVSLSNGRRKSRNTRYVELRIVIKAYDKLPSSTGMNATQIQIIDKDLVIEVDGCIRRAFAYSWKVLIFPPNLAIHLSFWACEILDILLQLQRTYTRWLAPQPKCTDSKAKIPLQKVLTLRDKNVWRLWLRRTAGTKCLVRKQKISETNDVIVKKPWQPELLM